MILRGIISLLTSLSLIATLLLAVPASAAELSQVLQGKEQQSNDAPTISAPAETSPAIDDARQPVRAVVATPPASVIRRSSIAATFGSPTVQRYLSGATAAPPGHTLRTQYIFLLLAELLI